MINYLNMTNIVARNRIKGKEFEIMVDMDSALKMKKGLNVSIGEVMQTDDIFYDLKKGLHASSSDLKDHFGTEDVNEVAEKIVKSGELVLPTEYKNKEREQKVKQMVDFLSKNAADPRTNKPYTPETISRAIGEAGISIENKAINAQLGKVMEKLRTVLPIKIETKKIILNIPAVHTGKVYGVIKDYKESEEWLNDGSLKATIKIPIGIQLEFYDILNSATHGSVTTEEIKNE